MRLKDIMTTDLKTVAFDAPAVFANELMWRQAIHHLIVMDGNTMVGILSDTDLGGPNARDIPDHLRVADVMKTRVRTADPNMTVKEAVNLMKALNIHCLPVMENEKLLGIVTATDLVNLAKRGRAHAPFQGIENQRNVPLSDI